MARAASSWPARSAGILLLALLAAGCAMPPAGSGAACRPEKQAELALSFRRNVPMVALRLDGAPAAMILDTGAAASLVTPAAVQRLALRRDDTLLYLGMGIGGSVYSQGVRARRLELDGVALRDHPLVVAGFPLRGWGDPVPDGLIGNDVLRGFDVDLDFAAGRMTLYRPCPGAVPPWDEPWTALRRPAGAPARNLVYLPVELDGRALVGFLDSGAMVTVVDTAAAHAVGVDAATLAAGRPVEIQGAAPADVTARVHRFRSLRIGPDTGQAPPLLVADLPAGHGDVLVGVGYLHARRVWISFASGTVFVGRVGGVGP